MNFKTNSQNGGCLILFGLPFLGAGLFMFWFLVLSPIMESSQSDNWVKTPCVITKAELESSTDEDGTSYRAKIHYDYNYQGKTYNSEQLDFSANSFSSDKGGEEKYLTQFPKGSKRHCYVNPDNPVEAVLNKDWGRGIFKWIAIPFSGVFIVVGIGVMLFGASPWLFAKKKKKYARQSPELLTPTKQRLGGLMGYLFINLFWNGIVSVFVIVWISMLISGEEEGFLRWGMGLFLLPFVCIGVFLMYKLYCEFINFLKAPGVKLTVKQGTVWRCGGYVDISWDVPFDSIVDSLHLDFVCKESATYRRGTTTSTDTETVATIEMTKAENPSNIGRCHFMVPENLMPSFDSNNNSIKWGISVKTEGPGPDAEDFYKIELLSAE